MRRRYTTVIMEGAYIAAPGQGGGYAPPAGTPVPGPVYGVPVYARGGAVPQAAVYQPYAYGGAAQPQQGYAPYGQATYAAQQQQQAPPYGYAPAPAGYAPAPAGYAPAPAGYTAAAASGFPSSKG